MANIIYTNEDDWNAGDINTAFQDLAVTANTEQQIGRYDVPASARGAAVGGGKVYLELFDDTTTQVREDGIVRFYYVNNNTGNKSKAGEFRTELIGPSGQAAVMSEQLFLSPLTTADGKIAPGGGEIHITFESDASDTFDSTDHVWRVPVTLM